MNARVFPVVGLLALSCLPLLAACGSSKHENKDGPPEDANGPTTSDGLMVPEDSHTAGNTDGPFLPVVDAPATATEVPQTDGGSKSDTFVGLKDAGPVIDGRPSITEDSSGPSKTDGAIVPEDTSDVEVSDGPSQPVDAPPARADVPLSDGGSTADGYFFKSVDGRLFQLVDYCLPILPLPTDGGRSCPTTADDAMVAAKVDAYPPWAPSPTVARCSEGPFVYVPSLGTACYFSSGSRQLISITHVEDTPSACGQSGTASFTYAVYGQFVTCTGLTPIAVDAGSGQ